MAFAALGLGIILLSLVFKFSTEQSQPSRMHEFFIPFLDAYMIQFVVCLI